MVNIKKIVLMYTLLQMAIVRTKAGKNAWDEFSHYEFNYQGVCDENYYKNIQDYTKANFYKNISTLKAQQNDQKVDKQMEEHFGFHRNEIATYIKQLQDLQKYFEEPQQNINAQIFFKYRLRSLGKYIQDKLQLNKGSENFYDFDKNMKENQKTVNEFFGSYYQEQLKDKIEIYDQDQQYFVDDAISYINNDGQYSDVIQKKIPYSDLYFEDELCGIYHIIPDVIDEMTQLGTNSESNYTKFEQKQKSIFNQTIIQYLQLEYRNCPENGWYNAITRIVNQLHNNLDKEEIDNIIDQNHVDLPNYSNFYVENIINNLEDDQIKKNVYLKDIHMINLIRKLSNFEIDEFSKLKDVKDIYYNREILIDLDEIPNIIIDNNLYPKDMIEKDSTSDQIKENTEIKNFNKDVMDTIYSLYTDVRLDIDEQQTIDNNDKDKIPIYERVLKKFNTYSKNTEDEKIPVELNKKYLTEYYPNVRVVIHILLGLKDNKQVVNDIKENKEINEIPVLNFIHEQKSNKNKDIKDIADTFVQETINKELDDANKTIQNQMIKLQNRSRPKDQGKFTEIIESEEEPSKEDTEIIQTLLQNVKHTAIGKVSKNINDLDEVEKQVLEVHSKEIAALIVNTIDKNTDKEEDKSFALQIMYKLLWKKEKIQQKDKTNEDVFKENLLNGIYLQLKSNLQLNVHKLRGLATLYIWKNEQTQLGHEYYLSSLFSPEERQAIDKISRTDIDLVLQLLEHGDENQVLKNKLQLAKKHVEGNTNTNFESDEFATSSEGNSDLVEVEELDEEEFGLENQEWVFKNYGHLQFQMKFMEFYEIFDILKPSTFQKNIHPNSEKQKHYKASEYNDISFKNEINSLGSIFFTIHTIILRYRTLVSTDHKFRDPVDMIMNLTEHCLKTTYIYKNDQVNKDEMKVFYSDMGSVDRQYDDIHQCNLPYTEYEAMLMFFKYYKAQKENDIKSLELNVFGKLKNNINTTPMIVLLKNVSNIDMNEHQICSSNYGNPKETGGDTIENIQQLCREMKLISDLQDHFGSKVNMQTIELILSEETQGYKIQDNKLVFWNFLTYMKKIKQYTYQKLFLSYLHDGSHIQQSSDYPTFQQYIEISSQDISNWLVDYVRLSHSIINDKYNNIIEAIENLIPSDSMDEIETKDLQNFFEKTQTVSYNSHSQDIKTKHYEVISIFLLFAHSPQRVNYLLQQMGQKQAWILLNLEDFKYSKIQVIDKFEEQTQIKGRGHKVFVRLMKNFIKTIDKEQKPVVQKSILQENKESDKLIKGSQNKVGNFVMTQEDLNYEPEIDMGEINQEFNIKGISSEQEAKKIKDIINELIQNEEIDEERLKNIEGEIGIEDLKSLQQQVADLKLAGNDVKITDIEGFINEEQVDSDKSNRKTFKLI